MTEKQCFKCQQVKPLTDFYKHPQMADGHVNKCKECNKRDVSANYRANIDYYKEYDKERNQRYERRCYISQNYRRLREQNPEKYRAYKQAYLKQNKERRMKTLQDQRKKFPEKYKARQAVAEAVKQGKLKKQPCQKCGETNRVHAHHPDYSQPLNVIWLCVKCHAKEHSVYPVA